MADVAVAVVRLLQRAQHERGPALASVAAAPGLAGDEPTDPGGELAGLGGGESLRNRWGRHPERRELLDEELDPGRVGELVDPVEAGDPTPLGELGDALVGEDHQV